MDRKLTRSERAMFCVDRISSLNFTTIARVSGPLTEAALQAGLTAAAARHPFLTTRIALDPNNDPWFRSGGLPPSLRRAAGDDWVLESEREINEPMDSTQGPLMRCVYLSHSPVDHSVLLTLHHCIGDGMSGVFLLRDVLQAAGAHLLGKDPVLPALAKSPSMDDRFPAAGRGLAGWWAILKLVLRELWLAIRIGQSDRVRLDRQARAYERRSRFTQEVLDPATSARLAECARAEGTTVHGALSAALILATVADHVPHPNGKPSRVGFGSPVNVRKVLDPPIGENLGFYISMALWGGLVNPAHSFWDLARAIRQAAVKDQAEGLTWAGLRVMNGLLDLLGGLRVAPRKLAERWEDSVPATTGLTNLGRLEIETRFGPLELQACHFVTCPSSLGSWMATATSLHGRLFWNFQWTDPSLTDAHAKALAASAVGLLRSAIGMPAPAMKEPAASEGGGLFRERLTGRSSAS